jgi:hypothetical protein
MANFFSAKNAKVRSGAGASTVTSKKWNVDFDADELEVSNFEGAGFSDTITGLKRATITIDLDLDGAAATTNPWDTTSFNWNPGNDITNLRCYLNDTTGPSWLFPIARCVKASNPMDVKQQGMATFVFKNRGTFTAPSGAIAP